MSLVLYDQPGPRARRRILLGSLVASAALLAVAAWVAMRLADQDQFDADKWTPIFDPGHQSFNDLWRFLGGGLQNTLKVALFAIVFSLVVGTLFAVTRVSAAPSYRWAVVGVIELLRGVPVVIAIFFAARVLPEVGLDLPMMWYLVIGLTAYNSVVIAEIIRAGIQALPRGQTEAAYAIGLSRGQTLQLILLPQAFRIMLPALISQLVVVLKDSSLGALIGYEELLRRGSIAVQSLQNPLQVYLLVGAIFVVVNYALSKLAQYVERRLSQRRSAARMVAIEATERESTANLGA